VVDFQPQLCVALMPSLPPAISLLAWSHVDRVGSAFVAAAAYQQPRKEARDRIRAIRHVNGSEQLATEAV
jgi:hypothetical protein